MVNLYASPAVRLVVVDVPLIEDCRACCPGVYLAISHESNQQGTFDGAEVHWSRDDVVYEPLAVLAVESIIGRALGALAAPPTCTAGFDEESTVDVEVLGSLKPSSISGDEAADGKNLALLGGEVINFRDATQLDAITYRLSGLLRGRLGTEALWGSHVVGDDFVVLQPDRMAFVEMRMADIDTDRYFKAVTKNGSLSLAIPYQQRVRAMNLRGLPPHLVTTQRNVPGSLDVTITWQRRTRGTYRLLSSCSPRLCCCDEPNFELEIWNNLETVLLRTVELTETQTYAYTAAQQVADGIAAGDPIKLRIFQMSKSVGRGIGALVTVA